MHFSNKGWRGHDRGPAGGRARAAPGRRSAPCVCDGEQRLCACGRGGFAPVATAVWAPANPIDGEKVGLTQR